MKAEMDALKMKVSSLLDMKEEVRVMLNTIKTLKEDIKYIKNFNSKISDKTSRGTPQVECNMCGFKCGRKIPHTGDTNSLDRCG